MRNHIRLNVFILILIAHAGCKKEVSNPLFTIGSENQQINITTFDTIIEMAPYLSGERMYEYDIDDDGSIDLKFNCIQKRNSNDEYLYESSIEFTKPSFQVATAEIPEKIYKCNHPVYTYVHNTTYNNFSGYECEGISTFSKTESYLCPKMHKTGDTPTEAKSWSNNTLPLSDLVKSQDSYFYVKGNWNNKNTNYLLIKKSSGNNTKYGWVKISISNFCDIQIYEIALQTKTTENKNDFYVGVINNEIVVTTFDPPIKIVGQYNSINYEYDIDKNGEKDFYFTTYKGESSGGSTFQGSSLSFTDSTFRISTESILDTTYECFHKENFSSVNHLNYYTPDDNYDAVVDTEQTVYPTKYSANYVIQESSLWTNEKLIFAHFSDIRDENGKILFFTNQTYWNDQTEKYILFRKISGDKTLYGWLKISTLGYSRISFHEYALQKE